MAAGTTFSATQLIPFIITASIGTLLIVAGLAAWRFHERSVPIQLIAIGALALGTATLGLALVLLAWAFW